MQVPSCMVCLSSILLYPFGPQGLFLLKRNVKMNAAAFTQCKNAAAFLFLF
jgi:hypothetical protein